MFVSALNLNSNTVSVEVRPGVVVGEPVSVRVFPETRYIAVDNAATTVADVDTPTPGLTVSRRWKERSNTITVSGTMRLRQEPEIRALSVWRPEMYFLTVFRESLERRGIKVASLTISQQSLPSEEVVRFNRRLDSVLVFMNRMSDNLASECVLKTLGAERRGRPGSSEKGLSVVKEFLASNGMDTTAFVLADGSGLSRLNLNSADAIVGLLRMMHERSRNFSTYFMSLPAPAEQGTLLRRLKGTPAETALRAKTGTLSGVSTISGYVRTVDKHLLAFSILMQHYPARSSDYRKVQYSIAVFLSWLRRSTF
jgi:D-alanyl-D-alanine carboxypeptidase/D-alanyl-D-alanine-endopeptidase (penicillin-binding protein 4)